MRAIVAMVLAPLVAGCGAAAGGAAPRQSARPSGPAAVVSTPGAVSPGPSASGAAPSLPAAVTGSPAFTYAIPAGWRLVQQDANQVDLAAGGSVASAERIRLTRDPAQEATAGLPTTTVGGHTAYIVKDGPGDDGTYTRVWLISAGGGFYELLCSGYAGYDEQRLLSGCRAFTVSVHVQR